MKVMKRLAVAALCFFAGAVAVYFYTEAAYFTRPALLKDTGNEFDRCVNSYVITFPETWGKTNYKLVLTTQKTTRGPDSRLVDSRALEVWPKDRSITDYAGSRSCDFVMLIQEEPMVESHHRIPKPTSSTERKLAMRLLGFRTTEARDPAKARGWKHSAWDRPIAFLEGGLDMVDGWNVDIPMDFRLQRLPKWENGKLRVASIRTYDDQHAYDYHLDFVQQASP